MARRPVILIITPALAAANNGNWQTARRWSRLLGQRFSVRLQDRWDGQPADLMLALHARRSAADIAAWAMTGRPLVVALTGTDLYRDIVDDPAAQQSLTLADRLIVLQELGPRALPADCRAKATICFQSTTARRPQHKTARHLRLLAVGHLRPEKAPETYWALAGRLADHPDLYFDHIGGALDPGLAAQAAALMQAHPRFRWLGNLTHVRTRQRIARAHLLVHPSRMEGGAHVVMEALASGTPVLASRIDGNVGMLGEDYAGYFPLGDVDALAKQVLRCRRDPAFLGELQAQCALRAPLFAPDRERQTLIQLLLHTLESTQ